MGVGERAAVVILDGDRVLLMRRRKETEDYYVLPGGGIEPGETPDEAAVREAREETGLYVRLDRKLGVFDDNGRRGHYFLVTKFEGTQRVGGPERERMSPENRYDLEWAEVERLRVLEIRPAGIAAVCEGGLHRRDA
ncbi:NUDIX domain-containing protein [Rubrobacter tropicus]|uniref:NUDIX domain-containing protein n=1 Tax=Rubrobacter tropicus TaxID=2653851 RepID=A0A6G8Q6M7_9ACTN|nr:NUDIX domain-containing protein [Rubrobacter tropicus]QIN81977.1 NUDIX domain-containing protein [Rubrobacter tropicus]